MFFVTGKSNGVLAPGQLLTIWGGCFDDSCVVLFDGVAGVMDDVTDGALVVVCPDVVGEYSVSVQSSAGVVSVGTLAVAALADTPLRARPKDYSTDDFKGFVRGLFPRGNVLELGDGSNFGRFIAGLALAVAYLWGKIQDLFRDLDPAHTQSYSTWEGDLGLPVKGIQVNGFADRLAEIYRVACARGGCTKPYMLKMLRLMGYEAEIFEYYKESDAFSVTSLEYSEDGTSSEEVTYTFDFPDGADKKFYWLIRLHVSELKTNYATCESTCEDYLVDWTDYALESVINSIKPAHTAVIFSYDDGVRTGYMLDADGNRLMDSDGNYLSYETHLW